MIGSVAAVFSGSRFFGGNVSTFSTAWGVGLVSFAIYLVPWWLFLRHLDRYTPLPGTIRLAAFVWGAGIATCLLAVTANDAMLDIWMKTQGLAWSRDWAAGATAPLTEEFAKAAGLVALIGLAPRLVRSPYDGFILGAFIGLGFQVMEDVTYAGQSALSTFGDHQSLSALMIFAVRGALGIVSHALFSAVFCAGLMFVIGRDGERRALLGAACMLFAMAVHGSWDVMAALGGGGVGVFVAGGLSITLAIIGVVIVRASLPGTSVAGSPTCSRRRSRPVSCGRKKSKRSPAHRRRVAVSSGITVPVATVRGETDTCWVRFAIWRTKSRTRRTGTRTGSRSRAAKWRACAPADDPSVYRDATAAPWGRTHRAGRRR